MGERDFKDLASIGFATFFNGLWYSSYTQKTFSYCNSLTSVDKKIFSKVDRQRLNDW